jgi:predicted PurR-regulated permease PerM
VVFVVLVLLDRVDLRDRLLRLWSGSLHRSTDAMNEAGARISRYLTMQLVVNLSYGLPMAAGSG